MKIKRILSIVLVAFLISTILPVVSFASGTVTVSGQANFVSAPAGTCSKLAYTATYDNGTDAAVTDPAAFTWEVTKNGAVASDVFCVNGDLIVAGGAEGAYALTATHTATGTKSADFAIAVTPSVLYDWSTNIPTSGAVSARTDENGNAYHAGGDAGTSNFDFSNSNGLNTGVKTVQFKFMLPIGTTGWPSIIGDRAWKEYITVDIKTDGTYNIIRKTNGTGYYICDVSGNNKVLKLGSWYELSYVFDLDKGTCDLYLDGEYCKIKKSSGIVEIPWNETASTSQFRFYKNADDAVTYSGTPYTPSLKIDGDKTILVPQAQGKTAQCKFVASSLFGGSDNVTWSIPETTGVSIDANTGVVTVTDAASAGTVTVTANQNGLTDTANLNLFVINDDFSSYTEGTTIGSPYVGSPKSALEGTNMYASRVHSEYIGYYLPVVDGKYTIGTGNVVVEYKYKSSTNGTGILLKKTTGWNKKHALAANGLWEDVKIVYNPQTNRMTLFVNDYLQTSVYNKLDNLDGRLLERVLMYAEAVDDLKIYNVSESYPEVYIPTLGAVAPGSEMTLSYYYYDEGGMTENGTEIAWSYADSKDSATWTSLPEYDGKKTIDKTKTAELANKYIKAVITPKHADRYSNELIAGNAVTVVSQITDVVCDYAYTKDSAKFNPSTDSVNTNETLALKFTATQLGDSKVTYMVVMAQYSADGKELIGIDSRELTTAKNSDESITVSQKKEDSNIIKAFVWKKDGLIPVSLLIK